MTHRTTIQRLAAGPVDDWGNPGPGVWNDLAAGVPCRWWTQAEREVVGPDKTAVVEDAKVIMPKGTDVREADRLNGVTNKAGAVVRAGVLVIESVVSHRDHLELGVRGIA